MIDKIASELVELYQNSGSEFLDEAMVIIKSYTPNIYHSFFRVREDGVYEVLVSDIKDVDELRFLERALYKELPKDNFKGCFQLSVKRGSVQSHLAFPLMVKNALCGVWVLESSATGGIQFEEAIYKLANLMALFIQNECLEKACVQNLYLDAVTKLPGREYFSKVIEQLKKQKCKVFLGAFRMMNYREGIRMHGSSYMEKNFLNILHAIQGLEIGKLYVLSEDTVALLINESKQESFAGIKEVMNLAKGNVLLAGVFLQLEREENILTLLEEIFSVTASGSVWKRETSQISSLFVGAIEQDKEEQKATSIDTELVEELIFELTEGI